jgi:hypothetical protein
MVGLVGNIAAMSVTSSLPEGFKSHKKGCVQSNSRKVQRTDQTQLIPQELIFQGKSVFAEQTKTTSSTEGKNEPVLGFERGIGGRDGQKQEIE